MGHLFVAFAAMLWATDSLVRYPLVQSGLDPVRIVFFDHLLVTLLLSPFLIFRYRKKLFSLQPAQWTGLFLIGGGASAMGTLFFTASFKYVNPSVSILLQKLQPVFVILLAMTALGERPKRPFWVWAPVALLAGIVISFPDFNFDFFSRDALESKGSTFALGAALLWATATVVGKKMVSQVPPMVVTYWRFFFGLVGLGILFVIGGTPDLGWNPGGEAALFTDPKIWGSLLYISLVPGLLALVFYYHGMKRTTASNTTLMELLFPVTAVALNTAFLDSPLLPMQAAAALVLLFAVTQIGLQNK